MSRVLVLTREYLPTKITSWQKAIISVCNGKAEIVEDTGEVLYQKGATTIMMPSVIRLLKPIDGAKRAVKFSRVNVFTRDGYKCSYCGNKFPASKLNYDHVLPRRMGGKTDWNNIVSSCYPCNSRKADRTLAQAGMKLLSAPHKPKSLPMVGPKFDPNDIPESWKAYVALFLDMGKS